MYTYRFFNDYSEGAHPAILDLLSQTNLDQEEGYGNDELSKKAAALITEAVGNPEAAVHFVSGGTQANLLVLASLLKPYESVIAATTGHIAVHEAGAIEATGHKICTVEVPDGKLTPQAIKSILDTHTDEHMVKPGAVFISHSTEVGTIYHKAELEAISGLCKERGIYLYLDGARLGSGLMSTESDLTLPEISKLVDIFYIGGTKNGALLGEAIVITNPKLQEHFRYHLKQHGALLAKGRLIGAQFIALFTDNRYFELAQHANAMATKLTQGIEKHGYEFLTQSTTNQIFPIFPNMLIEKLEKAYGFYRWATVNEHTTAIRLVTSWATKEDKVDQFLTDLKSLV